MKWTLLGFLGLASIFTFASLSGVRLLGQSPNGNAPNPSPPNGPAFNRQPSLMPYRPQETGPKGPYTEYRPVQTIGPDGQPRMEWHSSQRDPRHEEGRQALREAQAKLRAPDASESDKKEARASIEKFLEDEFERDHKMRREQVTRLEEQVSKLRKQLDKREQSKSKIIELRMQLMENDAEGLSFPASFNELQRFDAMNVPAMATPGPLNSSLPGIPYSPPNQLMETSSPTLTTRELIDLRHRSSGQSLPPNMSRPPEKPSAPVIGR